MTVRTHVFNGRRYLIDVLGPVDGFTEQYTMDHIRSIIITVAPGTKNELETYIHESLHAENWAATEKVVSRVGKEIADFLWRLGYRKTKK